MEETSDCWSIYASLMSQLTHMILIGWLKLFGWNQKKEKNVNSCKYKGRRLPRIKFNDRNHVDDKTVWGLGGWCLSLHSSFLY